jgi:hypothetical protein
MKPFYLLGILAILIAVLVACGTGDAPQTQQETEPPAAVQAESPTNEPPQAEEQSSVAQVSAPLSTAEPDEERLHRSYPAPTGYPGFRKYYQKRCYPGCHYDSATSGEGDTAVAQPTVAAERPNRSYPAPTGYPGFRKYYQKRCYPGCHYDSSAAEPTRVHP